MGLQIEIGKKGEQIAKVFLESKGYLILEQNWRYSKAEIDIIARDEECLVFVEVKTRSYGFFGSPEEFVNAKKQKLIIKAASSYMEQIGHEWEIRFDVVSVMIHQGTPTINHFRDAFFPGVK